MPDVIDLAAIRAARAPEPFTPAPEVVCAGQLVVQGDEEVIFETDLIGDLSPTAGNAPLFTMVAELLERAARNLRARAIVAAAFDPELTGG